MNQEGTPTFEEINTIGQRSVINEPGESCYGKHVSRKISPIFTWLFLKLRVRPNTVTLLSVLAAVTGTILLLEDSPSSVVAGAVCWQLWLILDCSDGEVARLTGKSSLRGAYIDYLGHHLTNPLFVLPLVTRFWQLFGFTTFTTLFGVSSMLAMSFTRVTGESKLALLFQIARAEGERYKLPLPTKSHADLVQADVLSRFRNLGMLYTNVAVMLVVSGLLLLAALAPISPMFGMVAPYGFLFLGSFLISAAIVFGIRNVLSLE